MISSIRKSACFSQPLFFFFYMFLPPPPNFFGLSKSFYRFLVSSFLHVVLPLILLPVTTDRRSRLPLLFYLRLLFRSVVTVIFAVILPVVLAIIFAVVSLAAHLYLIQYAAEDLASGHCQLILDPLGEAIADLTTGEDDHRTVTELGHDCSVDDASERWCIDNDHVILHPAYLYHLLKSGVAQQFTGVGWYRSCEEEMEVRNIRLADCRIEIYLSY